jgi:hypothetical protein
MKMTVFWDVAPCSLVQINQHFRGAYCLHHQGDKGRSISETLVNFYHTTRRNTSEDRHLQETHLHHVQTGSGACPTSRSIRMKRPEREADDWRFVSALPIYLHGLAGTGTASSFISKDRNGRIYPGIRLGKQKTTKHPRTVGIARDSNQMPPHYRLCHYWFSLPGLGERCGQWTLTRCWCKW